VLYDNPGLARLDRQPLREPCFGSRRVRREPRRAQRTRTCGDRFFRLALGLELHCAGFIPGLVRGIIDTGEFEILVVLGEGADGTQSGSEATVGLKVSGAEEARDRIGVIAAVDLDAGDSRSNTGLLVETDLEYPTRAVRIGRLGGNGVGGEGERYLLARGAHFHADVDELRLGGTGSDGDGADVGACLREIARINRDLEPQLMMFAKLSGVG
jgi:hypothetical protein